MAPTVRAWWLLKTKERAATFTTEDILDLQDAIEKSEELLGHLHFLWDRLADLEQRAASLALELHSGRSSVAPAARSDTSLPA
jgi:hypothetical protein